MWDFELGRAFAAMAKTSPFILFRMLVYFGMGLMYVFATGIGGAIGYGVTSFADNPGGGAGIGALIGFVVAAGIVYWLREYTLYIVKAGHLAVLVKHMDNEPLPHGRSQIAHARAEVAQRFTQASVLFALDQIVKGVLRTIFGLVSTIANLLPIPGLSQLAAIANSFVRMSLTYVDEIILAHILRDNSENPWEQGRQSLVLYAQNFGAIAKNAVWLAVFMWLLTIGVFAVIVGPVVALMSTFPGEFGVMSFLASFMLAWAFKAALLEPLAIYCLMNVYFKKIEGQVPNAEWDARLATASKKFRELKDKAAEGIGAAGTGVPQPGA